MLKIRKGDKSAFLRPWKKLIRFIKKKIKVRRVNRIGRLIKRVYRIIKEWINLSSYLAIKFLINLKYCLIIIKSLKKKINAPIIWSRYNRIKKASLIRKLKMLGWHRKNIKIREWSKRN
jgi:hypothetical protein